MSPKTVALAALAAAALALALTAWCRADRELIAAGRGESSWPPPTRPFVRPGPRSFRPAPAAPRLECRRPAAIHLIRFEDGSARLECGRHLLIRVSIPD